MSDNPKHTDDKDIFSQLIKQKLENHQLPVDNSVWEAIEQRMAPPRKRIIPPVWYWISGGVAAAVALLLILKPFPNTELTPAVSIVQQSEMIKPDSTRQQITHQQTIALANVPEVIPESAPVAEIKTVAEPKISTRTEKSTGNLQVMAENRKNEKESNYTEVITDKQDAKSTAEKKKDEKEVTGEPESKNIAVTEKNRIAATEITSLPDLNDYPEIPAETRKTRKKRPVLIAANVGSGGSFPSSEKDAPVNNFYMGSPTLVKKEIVSNYASVLNANDYSEAKHDPPLSVGITLVKPLNSTFSLESGLVYTYLKSDYFRPGLTNYRGVLQLHYLGVPLNVRAGLINQSKWNLYISAGGMLEKGLRSSYVQEIEDGQSTTNTDVKSGIEGVQWSLNGALGVDYKIQKQLSLFIEPKLTYYLRNNQPRSARTEEPLTIGLNGGLRIEL